MPTIPGYLTTNEAAERIGVTQSRIRHMIADGQLSATKVGTTWLIPITTVEGFQKQSPGWKKGRPRKIGGNP